MKRTTAGSAEAAEANYAPAEAAEALVTKKGFCSSTAWTAAATSEASSAARAVTAASARAVEEGEGKRAPRGGCRGEGDYSREHTLKQRKQTTHEWRQQRRLWPMLL